MPTALSSKTLRSSVDRRSWKASDVPKAVAHRKPDSLSSSTSRRVSPVPQLLMLRATTSAIRLRSAVRLMNPSEEATTEGKALFKSTLPTVVGTHPDLMATSVLNQIGVRAWTRPSSRACSISPTSEKRRAPYHSTGVSDLGSCTPGGRHVASHQPSAISLSGMMTGLPSLGLRRFLVAARRVVASRLASGESGR